MGQYQFVCGAECGIVTAGSALAANRHIVSVQGAPAIGTSVVRSGSRSYTFAAAASVPCIDLYSPANQSVSYWRLYFRITGNPSSTIRLINNNGGGNDPRAFISTGGVLQVGFATASVDGLTCAADTWYGIEAEFDESANPRVIRWRDWSAATGWTKRADASSAEAASVYLTGGSLSFGMVAGPTSGVTLYCDDVVMAAGTTPGEFYSETTPKGGKVLRYLPTADGTHTFADNDFEYDDTTGILAAATNIYTYLDDSDQTSIADGFISQNVSGIGKFFQVLFADESERNNPRCVGVTNTFHSSGTLANEANVRVSDDGVTWTNVWGDWAGVGIDVSDTIAHFTHKVLSTKPTGGAWTRAAVNGMRAEMGASNDVDAVPYYDSISLEVEWLEQSFAPPVNRHHLLRR